MTERCCDVGCWQELVAAIAAGVDRETLARQTGALTRRREVRSAGDLLRLALAYGSGQGSLQTTAAWAAQAGGAELSDTALHNRLRHAAGWLGAIAGQPLAAPPGGSPLPPPPPAGRYRGVPQPGDPA